MKYVNHFVLRLAGLILFLFFSSILGFIYFFVGPQVYKYDYTQKLVVGVEKANSWLGC